MAIEFTNKLLNYSNNQTTNSTGQPRSLLGNITHEPTPDGNQTGKVITLGQDDGFFYGDLAVTNLPDQPSPNANIIVSDVVDYEISFWFYQNHEYGSLEMSLAAYTGAVTGSNNNLMTEGGQVITTEDGRIVLASGYIGNIYQIPTLDIRNFVPNSFFFKYGDKICGNPGRWNFARYILYRNDVYNIEKNFLGKQPITSLGVGTNLIMKKNTRFINLKLINYSPAVKIFNMVIKPARTPYSTGFIQSGDIIEVWRKINNNELNPNLIDRTAKQKLLPYNMGHAPINI